MLHPSATMLNIFEILHLGVIDNTPILGDLLLSTLNGDVQLLNKLSDQNGKLKTSLDLAAGSY